MLSIKSRFSLLMSNKIIKVYFFPSVLKKWKDIRLNLQLRKRHNWSKASVFIYHNYYNINLCGIKLCEKSDPKFFKVSQSWIK